MEHVPAIIRRCFAQLDDRLRSEDGVTGAATGIPSLDHAGGLDPGELLVLAGPPSSGKTTFALHVGTSAARKQTNVLYVALSETADEIVGRMLALDAGVCRSRIRRAQLTRGELKRLTDAAASTRALPLSIEDAADVTATALRDVIRTWRPADKDRSAMVIIDPVELLRPEHPRTDRRDELLDSVRILTSVAKDERLIFVLVSRLDARVASRPPRLGDLREAGPLLDAATAVLAVHEPEGQDAHQLLLLKHRRRGPALDTYVLDQASGALRHVSSSEPLVEDRSEVVP